MKSIAVSLSLLAAVSSAAVQTTVWEDFTATVTPHHFFKSGVSTSAEISSTRVSSPSLQASSLPSSSGRPEITGPVVTSSVPAISTTSSSRSFIRSPTGSLSFRYSNSSSIDTGSPYAPSSYVEIVPTDSAQATSSNGDSIPQVTTSSSSSGVSTSDSSASDPVSSTDSASDPVSTTDSSASDPVSSTDSFASSTDSPSSQITSASASSDITSATSSSSSSTPQPTTLDSVTANLILAEHNVKRALHENTPPLTWSDDLSAWAYNYANSLAGTNYDPCSGNLLHSSTRNNQGENIAFGTYSSAVALVDYWYDEIRYYDFNNVTGIVHDGYDVGHFTQLVWASTTEVGCAAIECPANNGLYLLCEYTPAGNVYIGNSDDTFALFRTNVLPLIPQ